MPTDREPPNGSNSTPREAVWAMLLSGIALLVLGSVMFGAEGRVGMAIGVSAGAFIVAGLWLAEESRQ